MKPFMCYKVVRVSGGGYRSAVEHVHVVRYRIGHRARPHRAAMPLAGFARIAQFHAFLAGMQWRSVEEFRVLRGLGKLSKHEPWWLSSAPWGTLLLSEFTPIMEVC